MITLHTKGKAILAIEKGGVCWSRARQEKGEFTGLARACQIEGCRGWAVGVRWEDGALTFPCTSGMSTASGEWEIL